MCNVALHPDNMHDDGRDIYRKSVLGLRRTAAFPARTGRTCTPDNGVLTAPDSKLEPTDSYPQPIVPLCGILRGEEQERQTGNKKIMDNYRMHRLYLMDSRIFPRLCKRNYTFGIIFADEM